MKKLLCIVVLSMLLIGIASCGANVEKLAEEEMYPDFPGSLEVVYDSMEELEQDAEAVVQIEILGQEVIPLDGLPQTHSRASVKAVLKGELMEDDVIEIVEEGENGVVYLGVPPMDPEKEYILYLKKYEEQYYVCGAFQGKFVIKKGYVFQQGTEGVRIEEYSPVKAEEFIEKYSE